MKKVLIIPNLNDLGTCVQLAEQYNLGFEYNEFFSPKVLDDAAEQKKIINTYKSAQLPAYMTLHGAFFDVIPFSVDPKITEIATLRIEQSITIAKDLGAKAVVFHTNYNPFLNTPSYIAGWVETNIAYWSKVLEAHPNMNIYLENMFDTSIGGNVSGGNVMNFYIQGNNAMEIGDEVSRVLEKTVGKANSKMMWW